ncbi:MAG: 2,4'-dihydroxyacetophenone dioxygenase [uncultured Caballeronia sp.]|nr:MAG: 2,4'-dihydroxyacetophenone dioxygenase [uncultured Caballeronia sp.]
MRVFFIVSGPLLIWRDKNGDTTGYFDVHSYIELCRNHYEKVGLDATAVDKLFR